MSGLKGPGGNNRRTSRDEPQDDPPRGGRSGAEGTRSGGKPERTETATVVLGNPDPKKHSVRFDSTDAGAAISSVYINRSALPQRDVRRVRLTIEFLDD